MRTPTILRSSLSRSKAAIVSLAFCLPLVLAASGCRELAGATGDRDAAATAASPAALADRAPCRDRTPTRRALFGDLHVHTARSMDAYVFGTRTTPDEAYRYAKGEAIAPWPPDLAGPLGGTRRIDRALDFAAVTDHAESFGRVALCTDPDSPVYATASCRTYRGDATEDTNLDFLDTVQLVTRRTLAADSDAVCGEDGRRCRDAEADYWAEMQRTAERHYDRSGACAFTTFVAYEYSFSPALSKVHRNVIFRSEHVIDRPIHAYEEPVPLAMLRRLRDECNDGLFGCEALAIPHNPNLSDGRMFRTEYPGSMNRPQQARAARLRAAMEPVVEMMQVKGDSECRNGLVGVGGPVDEECGFEKMRSIASPEPADCRGEIGSGSLLGRGCVDRNDFVRTALVAGLAEAERIGANPFAFGFIGSTDQHDGTMGEVREDGSMAGGGRGSARVATNPGGLAGVWAEENSRDAIFDALKRRETFATSGPRIEPRFFAGADLPAGLCGRSDAVAAADAGGVPMGGELTNDDGRPPRFFVSASRDPGAPGVETNALERLQIVKGWVGEDGRYETRVHDVAGVKVPEANLSTETCASLDAGRDTLCAEWTDPAFDPATPAVYYARVLEVPSCRWSTRRCLDAEADDRPAWCDAPDVPKVVRERAWTSPIWVRPGA